MKKQELILVRIYSLNEFKDLVGDIRDNNIVCSARLYEYKIYTKNLILKCVVIPLGRDNIYYVKGMRAKGCFGFDERTTDYLTNKNNICKDYELINYVLEKS